MSTGGNLAEVRFKILRLCDFEEMDVCSVGGLALSKPYSTSGQAGKETCRRFLSLNAVWISLQFFTLLLVGLRILKVVAYLHKILVS